MLVEGGSERSGELLGGTVANLGGSVRSGVEGIAWAGTGTVEPVGWVIR